jgi:hypothetical protein
MKNETVHYLMFICFSLYRALLFILPQVFPNSELSSTQKSISEEVYNQVIGKLSAAYPKEVIWYFLSIKLKKYLLGLILHTQRLSLRFEVITRIFVQ